MTIKLESSPPWIPGLALSVRYEMTQVSVALRPLWWTIGTVRYVEQGPWRRWGAWVGPVYADVTRWDLS